MLFCHVESCVWKSFCALLANITQRRKTKNMQIFLLGSFPDVTSAAINFDTPYEIKQSITAFYSKQIVPKIRWNWVIWTQHERNWKSLKSLSWSGQCWLFPSPPALIIQSKCSFAFLIKQPRCFWRIHARLISLIPKPFILQQLVCQKILSQWRLQASI